MNCITPPKNETCDVIFLVKSSDQETYDMTLNAINSLRSSEEENKFRIILVESHQNNYYKYPVDLMLFYRGDFNYNKALNLAFENVQSEYVYVSNNDVVFLPNWYSQIRYYMDVFCLDTASPRCPQEQYGINPSATQEILSFPEHSVVKGYRSVVNFCGWGWIIKSSLLKQITPLSEEFTFWCQDDDLALTLQSMNKKHGLVTSSNVIHFGQKSYKNIPDHLKYSMTSGLMHKLREKWSK